MTRSSIGLVLNVISEIDRAICEIEVIRYLKRKQNILFWNFGFSVNFVKPASFKRLQDDVLESGRSQVSFREKQDNIVVTFWKLSKVFNSVP